MNKTLLNIKMLYDEMGGAEKRIATYILEHPDALLPLSISELATLCRCGDATVVRFSRRLGFSGYQKLKLALARETDNERLDDTIGPDDSCPNIFRKLSNDIYCSLEKTRAGLKEETFDAVVEALRKAERIVIIALGASAAVALDFTHKLLRIGYNATYYNDNHMQTIAAAQLKAGDVMIGITHSGSSRDIVEALTVARNNGAVTVAVTGAHNAPVHRVSDHVFESCSDETLHRILGLTSRIAQLTILDTIYTRLGRLLPDAQERIDRTETALSDKKF